MRVRLGKYFRGPGGTFASISTGGGGKKKGSTGVGTKVIIGLLIIGVAAILIMLAWISAIIYMIKCLIDKKTPNRKQKIIISSVVAVVSLCFTIYCVVTGSLTGFDVEWPKTEFEISENAEITLLPEPDTANVSELELCENNIAELDWDQTYQTATVTFTGAGSEELYFIANEEYQTSPVLITVTNPEAPEDVELDDESSAPSDSYSETPEESYSEPEEQPAQDIPDETSANPPQAQEEPVAEQNQVQEAEPTGEMVWITSGGERYHRDSSCSNMKNPREVTIDEAEALGKTPCQKCY